MNEFDRGEIEKVVSSLVSAIEAQPLRLAVVGTSGVGKSSTVNALFNAGLSVSHTVACTKEFTTVPVSVDLTKIGENSGKRAALHVIDAPGLGESLRTDPIYIKRYREELPTCDVALWLMAARSRGLALDQKYLEQLHQSCRAIVFAVNQVDLVEPLDWLSGVNLPSVTQQSYIDEIVADRKLKISEVLGYVPEITAFSASRKYRLSSLFHALIEALPPERRALYDLVKGFKLEDQFPDGVSGNEDESQARPSLRSVLKKFIQFVLGKRSS